MNNLLFMYLGEDTQKLSCTAVGGMMRVSSHLFWRQPTHLSVYISDVSAGVTQEGHTFLFLFLTHLLPAELVFDF